MTLRIAVTGWTGQVVCAMLERVPVGVEVIALRRPDLDLAVPKTVAPALRSARPDVIVTPHTANTPAMAVPLLSARIRDNVARWARGEELVGLVDPDLGY